MFGMVDNASRMGDAVKVRCLEDTVEKVAALLFQFARKKIDLSDRSTNRSRTPVKGKTTPENLAIETDSDFFNSIWSEPDVGMSDRVHARMAEDGRTVPGYCPADRGSSLRLFRHLERIVNLDAEVSHCTFQFRVTE
jgi:hypothetical protein